MTTPEYFRNQFRSWQTMEEYFGIKEPGSHFIPIDWEKILPPDQVKIMEDFIETAKQRQIEKAKLN